MTEILITGGAGYIASHTVVELVERGYTPVLVDNFANSSKQVLNRLQEILGREIIFYELSLLDSKQLSTVFQHHEFEAVIHFAGLKAVGESIQMPLRYYQENVGGALNLFRLMQEYECRKLVFSSSATVYGDPATVPITEAFPLGATNPYGTSKLMIEQILFDLANADPDWQISLLRYFNPVAAHPSGLIGEDPNGVPSNLMPYIAQVAVGKRDKLQVYGNDYPTKDGTGVRDYIHVMDLASAHAKALSALKDGHGCEAYNLGTGRGYSVLEMVSAFERASGKTIPYKVVERRFGDVAEAYADPSKAKSRLGWQARYDLDVMMRDQWRWQSQNPNGYNPNVYKDSPEES